MVKSYIVLTRAHRQISQVVYLRNECTPRCRLGGKTRWSWDQHVGILQLTWQQLRNPDFNFGKICLSRFYIYI